MDQDDKKLWAQVHERTLEKYAGRMATYDFWIEVNQLTNWDGGTRDEIFPRISISFK